MSCCPPNADKYLAPTYDTTGKQVTLPSGNEVYQSGSVGESKRAILLIPDVYGWNGGRTRNLADLFAEAGYFVVVPKLLAPGLQGGVDGDGKIFTCIWYLQQCFFIRRSFLHIYTGLFANFDFSNPEHTAPGFPFLGSFDWEGNILIAYVIDITNTHLIISISLQLVETGNLHPKIADAVTYIKSQGATQIGGVGFCW